MFELQFDKVAYNNISELGLPFDVVGKIENIYYVSLNNQVNSSQMDALFSNIFYGSFYVLLESPDFFLHDIESDFKASGITYRLLEKDKIIFIHAEAKTKEQVQIVTKYSMLLGNMNYLVIWSNEINLINVETVNRSLLFSLLKKKSIECKAITTKNTTFIWFAHDLSGIFLFSNDKHLSNLQVPSSNPIETE